MCETEIIDCIQVKKHVHKGRKETTHVRVGEINIHPHIKRISTMHAQKWSQDLKHKNNVTIKERKEKDT